MNKLKTILVAGAALFGAVQAWGVDVSTWADLKANLEAGNDVKLVQDVAQSATDSRVSLATPGMVTLDLNGHTITKSPIRWFAQVCSSGAKLTLTDTSSEKTGKVVQASGTTHSDNGGALRIDAGEVVVNGGTYSGLSCQASGGFAYVASGATLTMNDGTISGCKAKSAAGAVFVAGNSTCNVYGGSFINNHADEYGGAIYAGTTANIYGGYFSGNTASMAGQTFIVYNYGKTGRLYGGVFADGDPTGAAQSGSCLVLQDSAAVTQVDTKYIVGKSIAYDADNQLTAGTYTFCPTNAEYVAAGVALAPGSFTKKTGDPEWQILTGTAAGDNVWTYVEDGVCTVFGTGTTCEGNPKGVDAEAITSVVIADGVTGIGSRFFKYFSNLNSVTGGKDLATVGKNAFYLCMSLETIALDCTEIPAGLSDAIVFQTAIKPEGEAYLIPAISVKGYSQVLYGKKSLDDDEWTNLGSPADRSIYETDGYHFFQIRLVK